MSKSGDEDDEEECFYESLDRIASSCSCSTSNSDDDRDSNANSPNYDSEHPFPIPKFPMAVSNYDIWISEPASVLERRSRLLREMGLSGDPSLSRANTASQLDHTEKGVGDFGRSASSDYLSRQQQPPPPPAIIRSKSDGSADCSRNKSSSQASGSDIGDNQFVKSRSCKSEGAPSVAYTVSQHKPPSGKNCRFADEIRSDSLVLNANSDPNPSSMYQNADSRRVLREDSACSTSGKVNEKACTIKDLDNGKEFVVNEISADGMWNKLKEVGTGRQLTMEEFEMCVGHSPIVQELMRRQNVEDGCNENINLNVNGVIGSSSKMKKKGGWFKSIKSTVKGQKERRSSDERDTSSEKGGRRSSSATDDSQDVSFHGPERVRVRQYGKSTKEFSALYKSQEIQAHSGSIWTIKFSLDGKYLASAGEDRVIHVWQVVESERKGDLLMEKPEEGNLSFLFAANESPEPTSLSPNVDSHHEKKRRGRSSLSRKSVSLEHIMVPETVFGLSEKPICSFQGHLNDVLDLSWSKSQHLLSSSMDKTVRLWQLSSKSCLHIFSHSDFVTCIQFNPIDDRYFISGSLDAKVRIWSIPDRQVVDWSDLHEMVTAACYTPDGKGALVGSYKGSCRLYSTSENKMQQKSEINLQNKKKKSSHKKITGFQFAPGSSSEVLITSADSRIRVVDGVDLVQRFKGFRNTNSQISACLSANGRYVISASEDSHVCIWKHEADARPSRSKGVTVVRSYEHFHCQDVSVAIPWPGMGDSWGLHDDYCGDNNAIENHLDEVYSANHPPTPVEAANGSEDSLSASGCTNSPLHGTLSSATNSYFFDRISATWPEEKLVLNPRNNRSPHSSVDIASGMFQGSSAWGMVIVTAGLRGEIRTFQNFGLPVKI
ncbi:WD repeat-containing protein 44 isoform X2 [Momordica charantia]|uniref:WD repeat-containing protein 44 isoform X2 n=1 Tax=Momordica charantia TaxID=3673 RepID=A0A6J1CCC8_MOMCH|nr:WD repeat-containing protein 44 isoform X2 [Momordica charantia]